MKREFRLPDFQAAQTPAGKSIINITHRTGSNLRETASSWRNAKDLLLGISVFQRLRQHFFRISPSHASGAALISSIARRVQYRETAVESSVGCRPSARMAD